MPLYEYQCVKCGRFELIKKFSDQPLSACPTCGQEVQKLFSAPAIQFKGTGWYVTDYARKGAPTSDKSETASSGDGGKSSGDGAKSSGDGGKSASDGAKASASDSNSSPQTSTSKDSSASGSSSSK